LKKPRSKRFKHINYSMRRIKDEKLKNRKFGIKIRIQDLRNKCDTHTHTYTHTHTHTHTHTVKNKL